MQYKYLNFTHQRALHWNGLTNFYSITEILESWYQGSGKDCVCVCVCVVCVCGLLAGACECVFSMLAAKVMCIITAQLLSHIKSDQMCVAYQDEARHD